MNHFTFKAARKTMALGMGLLLGSAGAASAQIAAAYSANFNSGVPAGMTLSGNAAVNGGYLKLTSNASNQQGVATINQFAPGHQVNAFDATFKVSMFGAANGPGADGFSFNLVNSSVAVPAVWQAEDGLTEGLSFNFDVYDNGGAEAPSIDVRWNGTLLRHLPMQTSQAPFGVTDPVAASRLVAIHLDADGTLDLSYGGVPLISNLATPFEPVADPKWVLGARAGTSSEYHWFDDLSINASVSEVAEFYSDFTSAPSGATTQGTAAVEGGYLKLTRNLVGQNGAFIVNDFPTSQDLLSFEATFKAALFGSSLPADGFSFNLVPAGTPVPSPILAPEEGLATGLSITFDTYNNGSAEAPAVEVLWNGSVLGHVNYQASSGLFFVLDPAFVARDVSIRMDPDGTLDVTHNGNVLFSNLATPYVPVYGAKFVLAARTGGAVDCHWFDNLRIKATFGAELIRGRVLASAAGLGNVQVTAALGPVEGAAPVSIPDNGVVESSQFIAASGALTFAKVNVNITHPFAGDLELTLVHPDGTEVRLKNADINEDGANWAASYPDSATPVGNLAALAGKSMAGTWRLRVRDAFAQDAGTLNAWSLSLGLPSVMTDAAGNYGISNLVAGTYTVKVERDGFVFNPSVRTATLGSGAINFDLISAFIAGRVTTQGVGFGGVSINAGAFTTVTDGDGNYRLTLPPGTYTATPVLAGHGFTPVQISPALGDANVNFAAASYPVSGRITDLLNHGVSGVNISAGAQSALSDGDGNYMIAQIPAGARTITPTRAGAAFTPANRALNVTAANSGVNFVVASSPPRISNIQDLTIARDGVAGPIRFTVDDTETRAGFLTLAASSSDATLVPASSIEFGGVGVDRTITVRPAAGLSGTATITVTVKDEAGLTASDSFALRVNAAPIAGIGAALTLDGADDAAQVNAPVIGNKGNFTVEAWATATAAGAARTLVAQGAGANKFSLGVNAAGVIQVSGVWDTGVPFPFGGWHHLAVAKETANTRLYIDGVLKASRGSAIPLPEQTAPFSIGRGMAGEFWLGGIDELRVWQSARTADEIARAMNARVAGTQKDLRALWHFDERAGANAFDAAPSALNATVTGNASRAQSTLIFDKYETTEDTSFADTLQVFDPDNDTLIFKLATIPQLGSITVNTNTGAFTYKPNANTSGTDHFSFSVNDGFAETDVAALTIVIAPDVNPPTISFISSQTIAEDTTLGPIAFTVGDSEEPVANLAVSATCSVPGLIATNGFVFGGAGANRTLTIIPATNQNGIATISLMVNDGGLTTTNNFLLTVTPVNDAPTISLVATQQVVSPGGSTPAVALTINDVDNPAASLQLSSASDNSAIVGSVAFGGGGNNRTVTVGTLNNFLGGLANVTVYVTDGTLTNSATLQVYANNPPSIDQVNAQKTYRNTSKDVFLEITDLGGNLNTTILTATSGNQSIVRNEDLSFTSRAVIGGSPFGTLVCNLIINPIPDVVGGTTITVTANDGVSGASMTFDLTVADRADYAFIELPNLEGAQSTTPLDVNDMGQVVGYATLPGGGKRAVLWDVNGPTPTVTALFNSDSVGYAINNSGRIVGRKDNAAFSYLNGATSALGGGGANSTAVDINRFGGVVGAVNFTTDLLYYFDGSAQTTLPSTFETQLQSDERRVMHINDAGDIFGTSAGSSHLYVWQVNADTTRTFRDLGTLNSSGVSSVGGLNNAGEIVVNAFTGPAVEPTIYNYRTSTSVGSLLGTLQAKVGGNFHFAQDINDSGEVVGYSTAGRGWVYTTDREAFPVSAFIPNGALTPTTATAINEAGDIVGVGTKPGYSAKFAYLVRRQVVIGQPQSPPLGAINPSTQKSFQPPQVESLDGMAIEDLSQATLWSALEQKLYFLRPMVARVTWMTTSDLNAPNPPAPIVRTMRAVWPTNPQIHIAGAPVDAEPLAEAYPYRAVTLNYSTVLGASLDSGSKQFNAKQTGYSVIRYLIAPEVELGGTPVLSTHSNYFQVVRTVAWNDPAYFRDAQPAVVGTKVADPRGASVSTNSPKSGWVVNEIAPYDGAGADRAYDRDSQTGPIIPVNRDTTSAADDLVVAFYQRNNFTGVLWADLTARFNIAWPGNAPKLVIANSSGSGALSASDYPEKRIYNQPNRALPGFNPNEEHAFFAPSGSGEGLFALRNDLNTLSASFALLKYRNPATGEWQIKPYAVVVTDATHTFDFTGVAGQEIQPPYPLSILPLCPDQTQIRAGLVFKDHRGKLFAKNGPTLADPAPTVVIRYFYPLQPGFYYDLNADGAADVAVGTCIAWNGVFPNNGGTKPVDVTYKIAWPSNTPALQIGETLLSAKRGLPEIRSFAAAEVVFDTRNPNGNAPLTATARLYDPLSARTLRLADVAGLPAGYSFPAEVALETVDGKQIFAGLPYQIRSRLSYDPQNRALTFAGFLNENVLGEPLLLINVMSARERNAIQALSAEAKFHSVIDALFNLTRNPNRLDIDGLPGADAALLIGFTTNASGAVIQESLGDLPKALTAGLPFTGPSVIQTNYIVIAENNSDALGALPVSLHVIRVDGGPFRGDLKIIFPDNVFDERLSVRHSSDFGGDPDRLEFEWWQHSDDADFNPVALPEVDNATGEITNANGWRLYKPATSGQNSITLGEGAETSLFTLTDNWFTMRYRGYVINGATNWSQWVGDPSSAAQTRAAFAPGWIKRVIEGINPFEARTTNFHDNATVTYASMLIQAGERYEGDIALNPSGANLNSIGLIQAYSTVLNRGKSLSINGLPAIDSDPANNALLLAASRISDLYMLLGNEAFSDAQDPTIGFFSDSLEFGTVATSIFAFQNQLDSLLDEELSLLRGRDDSASGVGARPVYNRLLWNFTGAEGEVAYERVYNVGDVNLDGVINENDGRLLFPQGHGDAWGHYLTATKTYYDLLRHPRFTWIPRTENVLVSGVAVRVDFLDERKFAAAAAAKAKAGAEIVDLTYRAKFVDNPEGQYQGYKDTDAARAWGVSEWGSRAGQGAYFDWLVGNAILPSQDPNPAHTGIQKIDRQTVSELDEIVALHRQVQSQLDKVDMGLNPLGLAKGVVPFDIDPALAVDARDQGAAGEGHFEQIYSRAVLAMNNTVTMWNQANSLTEALRRQQDTVDEFSANVVDQERDFKNRLIEIFGYPYAGDIGAGKTYPSGYDGPDIYHYMYVNTTELTGAGDAPAALGNIVTHFKPFVDGDKPANYYFAKDLAANSLPPGPVLDVQFPLAKGSWSFAAPASFAARRAPGELQLAISDLLQEETRLKQALVNYDDLIKNISDAATLLNSRSALGSNLVTILRKNKTQQESLNTQIIAAKDAQLVLRRISSVVSRTSEWLISTTPESVDDFLFPVDEFASGLIGGIGIAASEAMEIGADIAEGAQNRHEAAKESSQLQTDIDMEVATTNYEIQQQASELLALIREEASVRLECLNQSELVKQSFGRLQAAVAAGQRLLHERVVFRQRTAGLAQQNRYKDIAFRIFRNDALQKYRAQFDLAARYVYLAGSAYDYELNFLGGDSRGARDFFTDIIRQRSLGVMVEGLPITGRTGLSDPLARLKQNFEVLSPRFGLNNPQQETVRFSLRKELFRIRDGSDNEWRTTLRKSIVANLWDLPEFRRYCRPFAPENAGAQPGIVIRFPTTITFGMNFFGFPLGGGDSAYDPSLFSTKVNKLGAWFSGYNGAGLATAPRIYFFPAGMDTMRSPTGNTLSTRDWKILDQVVPVPFPIGAQDAGDPSFVPQLDSLSESFAQIRRYSSFRAYHDLGVFDDSQATSDSRLIGRSVWNSDWVLIIPGGTLLNDPNQGLDTFIDSVSDILLSLQSYSYSGD